MASGCSNAERCWRPSAKRDAQIAISVRARKSRTRMIAGPRGSSSAPDNGPDRRDDPPPPEIDQEERVEDLAAIELPHWLNRGRRRNDQRGLVELHENHVARNERLIQLRARYALLRPELSRNTNPQTGTGRPSVWNDDLLVDLTPVIELVPQGLRMFRVVLGGLST
jgi:hypothetical protein